MNISSIININNIINLIFNNIINIININIIINQQKKRARIYLILFFMLLTAKSFDIFPKRNGYGFISELFALN